MKLLHVADIHAGIVTHSVQDPETGLPSALVSATRCFAAAVDIALEENVEAVVVAGDVYHAPNPTAAAVVGIARELERLRSAGIETLLIAGNHDRAPHPGQRSILRAHEHPLVAVSERAELLDLGDLLVGTLPSVSRHTILGRSGLSREAADFAVVDALERIVGTWAEDAKPPPDLIVGHWPIAGSVLGGEVDIAIIPEPMLTPTALEGPWRYVAMGHIHRAQIIPKSDGRLLGAYSGAIDRTSFGEESYVPVAHLVDFSGDDVTVEQRELPARIFRTISGDVVDRDGEPVLALDREDLLAANEGGVLRIRGSVPAFAYDAALRIAREAQSVLLDSGASIVRIEVTAEREDRIRSAEVSEAPTALEAFRAWAETRELSDDDRRDLVGLAGKLLEEGSA